MVTQLPAGLTGLLIASVFSAGMSTISTGFNSSATVFLTDYYKRYSKKPVSEKKSMKILYLSSLIISVLGIIVAIAMMNVKSALDAWWKLASIFSGGMLGIFLLAAFSRVTKSTNALIGTIAGLLVILWMSISPLIWGKQTLASHFHSFLITVFATTTIFFVGFFSSLLFQKNKDKISL